MAMAASRNLGATYGMLSKSIARLSSGLRINSAADDAAGLAVREFMRSEIAVLNQGVRNANDAVSMLQTMDGAAQVIDEKLIRMKELAEQAATGTYSIAQRAIMHSEFAAMRDEIDRIANATDFNDVKLLNGISAAAVAQKLGVTESLTDLSATAAGSTFITAFSGYAAGDQLSLSYTDNDGDTGTVSMTLKADTTITSVMAWINDTAADVRQTLGVTAEVCAVGVGANFVDAFTGYTAGEILELSYTNNAGGTGTVSLTLKSDTIIQDVLNWINFGAQATQTLTQTVSSAGATTASLFVDAFSGYTVDGNLVFSYNDHNGNFATSALAITALGTTVADVVTFISGLTGLNASYAADVLTITDETGGASRLAASMGGEALYNFSIGTAGQDATTGVALTADWANGTGLTLADDIAGYSQAAASFGGGATYAFSIGTIGADATADVNLTAAWSSATGGGFTLEDVVSGVSDAAAAFGGGASYAFSIETTGLAATENVKIHFGTGNEEAEDYYYVNKQDMTSSGLGIADLSIASQASAQATIETLNDAIQLKDESRAHFGAMMNRLANTVTNIQVQAENIQAAESQISDVDVALEMTRFVSNQIKAQAAVAMLAQANTLPQLALTLLGGR
jgi:flagellin